MSAQDETLRPLFADLDKQFRLGRYKKALSIAETSAYIFKGAAIARDAKRKG